MGPLLHSLNPALWGGMLHEGVADMGANLGHAAFWAAVLRIVTSPRAGVTGTARNWTTMLKLLDLCGGR